MRRPAVGNGDGLTRRVRLAAERGLTQRRASAAPAAGHRAENQGFSFW